MSAPVSWWWSVAVHSVALAGSVLVAKRWRDEAGKQARLAEAKAQWRDVLDFWFRGEGAGCWFLMEGERRDAFDELVRTKYSRLIGECEAGIKDWWADIQPSEYAGTLALILLLDQFTRHVFRGNEDRIAKAGIKARALTRLAIERGYHHKVRGDELGFLLMPYRHKKPADLDLLDQVLAIVDERERRALIEKSALSRFKRATEGRMSEARAEYEQIHGESRKTYTDEDILESVPPPGKELLDKLTEDNRGPVWKAIERYVDRTTRHNPNIIVSLSGGVDSMVILAVLVGIIHKKKLNVSVVAAHVDYGNRGESHAEADFVKRYSASLNVKCIVHRIAGLLRGVTDREEYEARSREIRFDLYKQVWREELNGSGPPVVLLGHHEGDVVENVLSNALKGKTILELSGMTEESALNGCIIRRPLLSLVKAHIFDYAHRFNVPYFKDTTPRWSTRGQVRLEVLPCLERVYGKGFQNHLARLAEQSDEAFALLSKDFFQDRVVSSSLLKAQRHFPVAFAFDMTCDMGAKPLFLWRLALRKAAHDHGILIATDKAVKFIYDSVILRQRSKSQGGWFAELRRGSRGYVWDNQYLLVFRYETEAMLPYQTLNKSQALEPNGVAVEFGCWRVSIHDDIDAATIPAVRMEDIWRRLVLEPNEPLEFKYVIEPSANGKYQLMSSAQVIPSLDIDIQLRGGLIPQVFPCERIPKVSPSIVVTVVWRESRC